MPKTTRKAERETLAKARRKTRVKLKAKQKSRYEHKKGVATKGKSHPHRATSAKR